MSCILLTQTHGANFNSQIFCKPYITWVNFILCQSIFPMWFKRKLHRLYLHSNLKRDLAPVQMFLYITFTTHRMNVAFQDSGISVAYESIHFIPTIIGGIMKCDVPNSLSFVHTQTHKTEVFSVFWIYKFLTSLNHSYWLAAGK